MSKDVLDTLIAEAGNNPDGLAAVAWVIQNRANEWGMTPEQVVKQKGQFVGYSNPGSGSKAAQKDAKVRAAAQKAWEGVQAGTIPDPTNGGLSFRTKGTKQSAPNGTVTIAGNTFAKGNKPSSALAAINQVAPLPAPRPLTAEAYAPSNKVRAISVNPDGTPVAPSVVAPSSRSLPDLQSALNAKAAIRSLPPIPQSRPSFAPPQALPTRAQIIAEAGSEQRANRSAPTVPQPPTALISRPVTTVKIDPYTGNPIVATAKPETLQAATTRKAAEMALQRSGAQTTTGTAGTAQMAAARPSVVDSLYAQIDAAQKPQTYQPGMTGRGLPTVSAPPQMTVAQRNAIAAVPPPPIRVANIPGQPAGSIATGKDETRLPTNAYAGTYAPPPAVAAIDAVAPPKIAPIPRYRPTALPTVPVPRVSPPAALPLSNFNTVNPMSQIVPRAQAFFNTTPAGHVYQALTGQPVQGGLLGGILSLLGNRQQAPQTPILAPRAPEQVGYNGTTQVTSDQLAGGNGSVFTTNTVLPDSMNNKRWLTGY